MIKNKNIKENNMNEKTKENFRQLARKGFGDDSVYDQADCLWIVFRLPRFSVCVKSFGGSHTDVKAVV